MAVFVHGTAQLQFAESGFELRVKVRKGLGIIPHVLAKRRHVLRHKGPFRGHRSKSRHRRGAREENSLPQRNGSQERLEIQEAEDLQLVGSNWGNAK